MEYRTLGQTDCRPSLLGFGCMRLPVVEGKIVEDLAKAMVDKAWQSGVNYFDTAYFYHDGASENFTARALAGKPRDSYYLTDKLPTGLIHSLDEAKRLYAIQKERLEGIKPDIFLLHALNGPRWREMVELGVLDWYLDLQRQGEFRYIGFSFHGGFDEFKEIVTARQWDVCQLQLNYMDVGEQAGIAGYELATQLGIPVIVMEPIKGGALAVPPQEMKEIFTDINPDASPASWALRWVGQLPNVVTMLSGMTTMEQVEDNLNTMDPFTPLNEAESQAVDRVAQMFRDRMKNGCTTCRYCMPCPAGVDIPGNFMLWNLLGVYGRHTRVEHNWKVLLGDKAKAKHCVDCGVCEEMCPQGIPIRTDLAKAQVELDTLYEG